MRLGHVAAALALSAAFTLVPGTASVAHADTPLVGEDGTVTVPHFVRPRAVAGDVVPDVEFVKNWQGTSYGAMLAPKELALDSEGGFDLIIHLNGAMMTEKEWRAAGVNAVVASIAIPTIVGTSGYSTMLGQPGYVDHILKETVHWLGKNGNPDAKKVNRIGVVAWSAGFGGVGKILGATNAGKLVDSVILLDGFHAGYLDPKTHLPKKGGETTPFIGLGSDYVDTSSLDRWKTFGEAAINRQKLLVITHASILPPDYASCGETTGALLKMLGVSKVATSDRNERSMEMSYAADSGDFHAKGWKGGGKHDHMDQLHLVGDLARAYLAPRWHRTLPAGSSIASK
jgi:hypothetical protein